MYAQFFGSYLLSQNALTTEQLTTAISKLSDTHIKLGTLAMHKGYMTSAEVDEVCYLQKREDKRFGEIALDRCYLFEDQLEDLLETQVPGYLKLGQTLIDLEFLTNAQLEDLLVGYDKENYIDNEEIHEAGTRHLIENFLEDADTHVDENAIVYLNLLFNNMLRFIGGDFTPLEPIVTTEHEPTYCVAQKMVGEITVTARLDMEKETAVAFASRYAEMDFDEFDEYVTASLEDFLNLHNGLYSVNLSNMYSIELKLNPPELEESSLIQLGGQSITIPIFYPFGTVYVIVSFE